MILATKGSFRLLVGIGKQLSIENLSTSETLRLYTDAIATSVLAILNWCIIRNPHRPRFDVVVECLEQKGWRVEPYGE